MAERTVRVEGLEELRRKLDFDTLVRPAVEEEIRDKVLERWQRPYRRTQAGRVNTISAETRPLGGSVFSTLRNPAVRGSSAPRHPNFNPRTTGRKWQEKLISAARSMVPNVIRRAIARIEARWAA